MNFDLGYSTLYIGCTNVYDKLNGESFIEKNDDVLKTIFNDFYAPNHINHSFYDFFSVLDNTHLQRYQDKTN